MIPSNAETYVFKVYKRKPNSPYEYEDSPKITFRGRPATNIEQKEYRIQKGVNGSTDSVFVFATNLPTDEITDGDRIEYLGKIWTITSVGYYIVDTRYVNAGIMNPKKIIERCPKGVTLQ